FHGVVVTNVKKTKLKERGFKTQLTEEEIPITTPQDFNPALASENVTTSLNDFSLMEEIPNQVLMVCTRGLCFECGGAITLSRSGLTCDICHHISSHVTCIPDSKLVEVESLDLFSCKNCDNMLN
ncbi:hypothetical protein GE061_004140, partial [Apolygus lucorum]